MKLISAGSDIKNASPCGELEKEEFRDLPAEIHRLKISGEAEEGSQRCPNLPTVKHGKSVSAHGSIAGVDDEINLVVMNCIFTRPPKADGKPERWSKYQLASRQRTSESKHLILTQAEAKIGMTIYQTDTPRRHEADQTRTKSRP